MADSRENHVDDDDLSSPARIIPGGRCVILRHSLTDGTAHFDWLLESTTSDHDRHDQDARTLVTFRTQHRPDAMRHGGEMVLQALPPHRRMYLDHEGAVSGDRGTVQRVREGTIELNLASGGENRLRIRWQPAADGSWSVHEFTLQPNAIAPDRWRLCCVRCSSRAE